MADRSEGSESTGRAPNGNSNPTAWTPGRVAEDQRDRSGGGEEANQVETGRIRRLLERVPEHVVPLGAGFMLVSVLITAFGTLFFGAMIASGDFAGSIFGVAYDFERHATRVPLALVQYFFASVALIAGIYFARQRRRWWVVITTCLFGASAFVTIPLLVPAFVLLVLGKAHFKTFETL